MHSQFDNAVSRDWLILPGCNGGSETPAIIILSYIRSSARFMIISGRCHLMRLSFTFLLSDTGWGWTAESSM